MGVKGGGLLELLNFFVVPIYFVQDCSLCFPFSTPTFHSPLPLPKFHFSRQAAFLALIYALVECWHGGSRSNRKGRVQRIDGIDLGQV